MSHAQSIQPTINIEPYKKRRVLILEDDLNMRAVFKAIIKRTLKDIEVDWVEFGEHAIELIEKRSKAFADLDPVDGILDGEANRPYLLVVADINLPGTLDGIQVWKYLQMRFPKMPVILTSGISSEEYWSRAEKHRALMDGAPTFLRKPFYIQDCKDLINILME